MTIEPQKPTVSADTIYSSVIGNNAIVNQTIVSQPRKASLFQLPATDPNFTGRSHEIDQIEAILTSDRPTALISAVSGMGGVGKSTLAKAIGHRLKAQYPDGQLYVDLRGQSESPREPIAVLTEFLVDGFGDEAQQLPPDLDRLQHLLTDRLSGKRILVVLDNAADAAQVEPLLPRVSGCGVLVTSRERLTGLAGVGAESFVPLDVMAIDEAIALLHRLCPEKTSDRELTTELVALCGRLPLALTIVGKLLLGSSLTLVELVRDLGVERLRLLKVRNTRDEIIANLDVEASFNLSYGRLLPEQRQVFLAVAVLRGVDFGTELAAVVGELEEAEVRRRLDQLVALALVEMPKETVGRYRFHDLMREFGRGKLEDGREEGLAGKALDWYDENANNFDSLLKPKYRRPIAESLVSEWEQPLETIESALDAMAVEWFLAEQQNLVGAVNWAEDLGEHSMVLRLTVNLIEFFDRRSFWSDWVMTHHVALKSAKAIGDQHGIAVTIGNLGLVYKKQGKWEEVINCYQQILETFRAIGDQHNIAVAMNSLGSVYQFQGKWEEAIDCYRQSLETFRAIGDQHGIAQTIGNLGNVYQLQGKWEEAIDCYQQSLETMRAIGDEHGIAQTMNNLGLVYKDRGKWEEAIDCYRQSLETFRAIGDEHGIAQTIGNLGNVYGSQGKWEEAIDCFQQSIQGSHAIGDPQTEANGWYNLGGTQANLGNPAARTSYQNAKALFQQLKLTDKVEACDNAIATIDNPRKKKRSFPLWQSAIVLLLLGIGGWAMNSQAPVTSPVQQERGK